MQGGNDSVYEASVEGLQSRYPYLASDQLALLHMANVSARTDGSGSTTDEEDDEELNGENPHKNSSIPSWARFDFNCGKTVSSIFKRSLENVSGRQEIGSFDNTKTLFSGVLPKKRNNLSRLVGQSWKPMFIRLFMDRLEYGSMANESFIPSKNSPIIFNSSLEVTVFGDYGENGTKSRSIQVLVEEQPSLQVANDTADDVPPPVTRLAVFRDDPADPTGRSLLDQLHFLSARVHQPHSAKKTTGSADRQPSRHTDARGGSTERSIVSPLRRRSVSFASSSRPETKGGGVLESSSFALNERFPFVEWSPHEGRQSVHQSLERPSPASSQERGGLRTLSLERPSGCSALRVTSIPKRPTIRGSGCRALQLPREAPGAPRRLFDPSSSSPPRGLSPARQPAGVHTDLLRFQSSSSTTATTTAAAAAATLRQEAAPTALQRRRFSASGRAPSSPPPPPPLFATPPFSSSSSSSTGFAGTVGLRRNLTAVRRPTPRVLGDVYPSAAEGCYAGSTRSAGKAAAAAAAGQPRGGSLERGTSSAPRRLPSRPRPPSSSSSSSSWSQRGQEPASGPTAREGPLPPQQPQPNLPSVPAPSRVRRPSAPRRSPSSPLARAPFSSVTTKPSLKLRERGERLPAERRAPKGVLARSLSETALPTRGSGATGTRSASNAAFPASVSSSSSSSSVSVVAGGTVPAPIALTAADSVRSGVTPASRKELPARENNSLERRTRVSPDARARDAARPKTKAVPSSPPPQPQIEFDDMWNY